MLSILRLTNVCQLCGASAAHKSVTSTKAFAFFTWPMAIDIFVTNVKKKSHQLPFSQLEKGVDVLRVNFENDLKLCVGQSPFRTMGFYFNFPHRTLQKQIRAQHILINNISGILSLSYKSVFVLTIPVVRQRIAVHFPLR